MIEGDDSGPSVEGVDAIRIRCGSDGGVTVVFADMFLLWQIGWGGGIPHYFAIGGTQTDQVALELGHVTRFAGGSGISGEAGQEDPVVDQDRARRARAWHGGLPDDVRVVTPGERNPPGLAGAQRTRPSKLGPVPMDEAGLPADPQGDPEYQEAREEQLGVGK